jgi:hypothetical protein
VEPGLPGDWDPGIWAPPAGVDEAPPLLCDSPLLPCEDELELEGELLELDGELLELDDWLLDELDEELLDDELLDDEDELDGGVGIEGVCGVVGVLALGQPVSTRHKLAAPIAASSVRGFRPPVAGRLLPL